MTRPFLGHRIHGNQRCFEGQRLNFQVILVTCSIPFVHPVSIGEAKDLEGVCEAFQVLFCLDDLVPSLRFQ